jgi:hypothetical protein
VGLADDGDGVLAAEIDRFDGDTLPATLRSSDGIERAGAG